MITRIEDEVDALEAAEEICSHFEPTEKCSISVLAEIITRRSGRGSTEGLSTNTLMALSFELVLRHQYELAVTTLRQYCARAVEITAADHSKALQLLGYCAVQTKNLHDAVGYYQACLDLDRTSGEAPGSVPSVSSVPTLVSLASVHSSMHNYTEAAAIFERALSAAPHDAEALLGKGLLMIKTNRSVSSGLTITAPPWPTRHASIQPALTRAHRPFLKAEAFVPFEVCTAHNPTFASCWRQLGILNLNARRYNDARARLARALELDPTDIGALHRLQYANTLMAQDSGPEAIAGVRFVTFASDATRCELRRLLESAVSSGAAQPTTTHDELPQRTTGYHKTRPRRAYGPLD